MATKEKGAAKDKEIIFLSAAKPHAVLVVKSAHHVELPSGQIKSHRGSRVAFVPNAEGVGEFRTSDPELIEFLREHQWYQSGYIFEAGSTVKPKLDGRGRKVSVKQGPAGSGEQVPEPETPAPQEEELPARAARVPLRRAQA